MSNSTCDWAEHLFTLKHDVNIILITCHASKWIVPLVTMTVSLIIYHRCWYWCHTLRWTVPLVNEQNTCSLWSTMMISSLSYFKMNRCSVIYEWNFTFSKYRCHFVSGYMLVVFSELYKDVCQISTSRNSK